VTGVTDVSPFHLYIRHSASIWRQEEDIAPKPDRLVFVFGMVVAMAVTILAITTWAAPPDPDSDSAWKLSLTPREPPLTQMIKQLCLRGEGEAVVEIEVQEPNGDRTITRIVAADPERRFTAAEQKQLFGIQPQ